MKKQDYLFIFSAFWFYLGVAGFLKGFAGENEITGLLYVLYFSFWTFYAMFIYPFIKILEDEGD